MSRTDLKLTGGLRWTDDQKHFIDIPSELLVGGYGYPSSGVVNQQWNQLTGRFAADWTPKLDFTDQTLRLWLLCAWLQGWRRQSTGRGVNSDILRQRVRRRGASADLQAGIRGCLRTRHQEYTARWRD